MFSCTFAVIKMLALNRLFLGQFELNFQVFIFSCPSTEVPNFHKHSVGHGDCNSATGLSNPVGKLFTTSKKT
jgi:hypothetical protein